MNNLEKLTCMHCGKSYMGKLMRCCDGYMCGCHGQPTEPEACSMWCYHQVFYKYQSYWFRLGMYLKNSWLNFKFRFKKRKNPVEILFVSEKEIESIIDTRKPIGLFYTKEEDLFIACDNSTGDAWIEAFEKKKHCIRYLRRR